MAIAGGSWWLAAGGLFGVAALLLSRVAPVLLMPMFYRSGRSIAKRCANGC